MPTDDETGLVEPDVAINGTALTFAQSMTLRVAVSGYRMLLDAPAMRETLGALGENYIAHLDAIVRLMLTRRTG